MSASQRAKGARGERTLATELRQAFPRLADGIRRGDQRWNGAAEPDVVIPGVPVWLEHKSGKLPNPRAALAQAIEASQGRGIPIAVIRDDRREPFACLRWADLLALLVRRHAQPEQ